MRKPPNTALEAIVLAGVLGAGSVAGTNVKDRGLKPRHAMKIDSASIRAHISEPGVGAMAVLAKNRKKKIAMLGGNPCDEHLWFELVQQIDNSHSVRMCQIIDR